MTRRPRGAALARLGPFELKDRLVALAAASARAGARTLLNAGRGNPDWVALRPRAAFVRLSEFALAESGRRAIAPGLGGPLETHGLARRLRAFLRGHRDEGSRLLAALLRRARSDYGFAPDAWVREFAGAALGDHYPAPVRMLPHCEAIVRRYLVEELYGGCEPPGGVALFATEGATAAICALFDALFANRLLRRGDRVAVGVPIFAPYLAIPRLPEYGLRLVPIEASARRADGSHRWQYPAAEIEKLADPAIRAFFLVNPSNPPSVAMAPETVRALVRLVRRRRPDLLLVTDDVYGTFVPGFRSLAAELPRHTILVYSFSKHFGMTGWRLGLIAMARPHLADRLLARLPESDRRRAARRYASLVERPEAMPFLDRVVAESRRIALQHTAGLSTPQQLQMAFAAAAALLDRGRLRRRLQALVQRRLRALYRGLGVPLPPDPLRAGYYAELDLLVWARRRHGPAFVRFLQRQKDPLELVVRLAERSAVVLMPGAAFGGPPWSVRVSLANQDVAACRRIGRELAAIARDYAAEWHRRGRPGAERRPN